MKKVTIILDLDHTLLDTDAFVAQTKTDGYELHDVITPKIWEQYNVFDYLYQDSEEWLRKKPKETLELLTAYTPTLGPQAEEFQRTKVYRHGLDQLFNRVVIMAGEKGLYMPKEQVNHEYVFVDDKLDHHLSVRKLAPHVHCLLMIRDDVDLPVVPEGVCVVRNLQDVSEYVEALV